MNRTRVNLLVGLTTKIGALSDPVAWEEAYLATFIDDSYVIDDTTRMAIDDFMEDK